MERGKHRPSLAMHMLLAAFHGGQRGSTCQKDTAPAATQEPSFSFSLHLCWYSCRRPTVLLRPLVCHETRGACTRGRRPSARALLLSAVSSTSAQLTESGEGIGTAGPTAAARAPARAAQLRPHLRSYVDTGRRPSPDGVAGIRVQAPREARQREPRHLIIRCTHAARKKGAHALALGGVSWVGVSAHRWRGGGTWEGQYFP